MYHNWLQIHDVAKDNLEPLASSSQELGLLYTSPCLAFVVPGIKPRTSCMLDNHYAILATSLAFKNSLVLNPICTCICQKEEI